MRSLPSGSLKNAMWQTPVSRMPPWNSTHLASSAARGGHVVDAERQRIALLRDERHADPLGLPDPEARVPRPALELRVLVRTQPRTSR
jgi:hypothetical protein